MHGFRTGMRASGASKLATAALAVCTGLTLLAASGCGSSPSGPSITLFNGQHPQTTDALVSAFEKASGITVNMQNNDEDVLADQIATEGSSSPGDVIYTENSPALEFLQGRGLLAKVDPATLAHTPARYNSPLGDWVGVSARVSVLIYNPSLISKSQLPTSVLQLASPRYRGKLAFAPQETDFQPIITSVMLKYGKARALSWLEGIKANAGAHIYNANEAIADAVNRGAVAFGVVNQYYWYRLRALVGASAIRSRITYFAPYDPGYIVDISGAAILKSSKHQADAQRFLEFLVSSQGQHIIATSSSYEYPIASGVTTAQPETPFDQLKPYPLSIAQLGNGLAAINLLREAGLL
jgi:iron(III) transport system substrate-binding protein